jgi:hypothetical protein
MKISEIGSDDFESKLIVAHENLHYVQSISTISCIRPFLTYWQCHAGLSAYLRAKADNSEERQALTSFYQQFLREMKHWNCIPEIAASDELATGPLLVKLENDDEFPLFVQNNTQLGNKFICYTRTALQESMALAYEIWLGRDASILDTALRSGKWQYMQYAIGIAGLHKATGWEDIRSLAWVTIVCADYALDHAFPGQIFLEAINQVSQNWEHPPYLSEISNIYELLGQSYDESGRTIVRQECKTVLDDFSEKAEDDPSQFDRAMSTLFQSMIFAMEVRERKPHLIVQALLLKPQSKWFLENFHMPMYLSGTSVVQSGVGSDKFRASLILEVGFHRLGNLLDGDSADPACPYAQSTSCSFEKNDKCRLRPWTQDRRLHGKEDVCVYEYVEQAYRFFE